MCCDYEIDECKNYFFQPSIPQTFSTTVIFSFNHLPCLRIASTALSMLSETLDLDHSDQNLTVALFGSILGLSIRILLGNKLASPTAIASPTSSIGNKSAKLPILSGSNFLLHFDHLSLSIS